MKDCIRIAILIVVISGCSAYTGVGSQTWHAQRMDELKMAYDGGKLEAAEYFRLKNETDQIYQEYNQPRYVYPAYHFGYGYYHHHR